MITLKIINYSEILNLHMITLKIINYSEILVILYMFLKTFKKQIKIIKIPNID